MGDLRSCAGHLAKETRALRGLGSGGRRCLALTLGGGIGGSRTGLLLRGRGGCAADGRSGRRRAGRSLARHCGLREVYRKSLRG